MRPHLLALAACTIAAVASLAAAQESDADLLLALPDACYENWDNATAGLAGAPWVEGTPPCGGGTAQPWFGVTCNAQGQVIKLAVTGKRLRCTHLPGELAHLPALEFLDLKCNALNSSVPAEWRAAGSFPVLQTLNLADNLLTGALSDYTKAHGGPLASVVFNVSRNLLSDSALPASWRSSTLQVLDVSYNRVPGSLPAQWAAPVAGQRSAFPQLHTLMVQGNALEGEYPYGNGSAFASNFSITARPGNGMLEGAPAAAPAADTSSSSSSGGLSGGAIAGIVIGCVAAAALAAVLAAYVLRRRRQRSVSAGAPSTAADTSAAGKLGWDKDVESGPGSNSPPGGSAWGSLGSAPPPAGEAASLRDSAMGSRATASSSPGGEGSGHGVGSARGSGTREGSGATQLSEGVAGDTDVRRLPGGWATIDFSELELSTVLGQGSFGCVRLAKWCQTTVAVKMLTLGSSQASGAEEEEQHAKLLRQLEKEAAVMSKLHHPNVCHLLAITRQPACLVMEYASRRSVDKLLVAGHRDAKVAKQLSWPRLLGMALDAARGMLYLHSRDVCHRDLKSANLLVTASWQVKVADFNLSRGADSQGLSTVVVQNPRWLAPERLAGGAGGLPSDVWAFGTVLWELLTWRHPHDDQNAYQIIHTVQAAASGSGLAVPPPDVLPAGPLAQYGEYVALMEACWARDPAQRPTMEAVATRLRNILAAEVGRPLTGSTASEMPSPQVSGPVELAPGLAAQVAAASGSQAALGSSAGRNSGSRASPFEAAAEASPFAAAPVRQPSDAAAASPFAAAPVRQPSNAAAASPFAAAPVRQPSDAAGASPFAAAAPKRQPSMGPSPFAAAPAQQPGGAADASPFAAAGMARQPSTAAGPSPFAAAASMARQPSTAPQSPPNGTASAARQASTAVPGAGAAGFDSGVDSVLASFARMEQVQRQLSKSASNSGKSSGAPSRTASGLMPAAGTPQRVRSGSRRGAAPPGDAGV